MVGIYLPKRELKNEKPPARLKHESDIFTASSKTAKPSILTRKHLSEQIGAGFDRARGANAGLTLGRNWQSGEQIRAEIHTNTPTGRLFHTRFFFKLYSALIGISAEWAQTCIDF